MKTRSTKRWGGVCVIPEIESAVMACRWVKWAAKGGGRPPFTVLFLHGPYGTGKSHLVRSLAAARDGALVTSAVDFSRNESHAAFDACELLVIEDVHRLPAVAVERLVTLLDTRSARRRLTVFTAAVNPFELRGLPRRLTSRLGGGLTVAIRTPGAESRHAVLAAYAKRHRRRLTSSDLLQLVERTDGGLRELLGAADARALERTRARAEALRPKSSTHDPAGTSPKRETYRDRLWAGEPGHVFENLMGDVADAFRLSESDIRGPGQLKTSVTARQTFAYLARYVLKVRQSEITKYLNRTPSSFGSAKLDLRWKMVRDPALHATVTKLEADWRAKVQKLVAPVSMETDEEAREGTG